jgi:hypothetical protein
LNNTELTDLLFDSDLSIKEIAVQLDEREQDVRKRIKQLGLGWVKERATSRGQAALADVIGRLLPGEKVVSEAPIGERLRLDVCCPRYRLAAEYHGRQHFEYVEHFHHDREGFEASKQRDRRKVELCEEKGIALVVFRAADDLSEDTVLARLLTALESTGPGSSMPGDEQRARERDYRRQSYQRMKSERPIL